MNAPKIPKTQVNNQAEVYDKSERGNGNSLMQFEGLRPGQISSGNLQQLADNSPHVQQLKSLQSIANKNLIQKKANNTGLPDNLKSGVENLSGYSMDDVKVHYNSDKPAQLQAHAYAQGTDIHLASGQEKHLPHEAWHVVQQKQGRVQPTIQMQEKLNVNDEVSLEHEADRMGELAISNTAQLKSFLKTNKISNNIVQKALGFNKELYRNEVLVTTEFVTEEHKKAISDYCSANHVTLSVRETGKLSLDRVKEGAKPKPHTILEKSIKESSLAKAHPEAAKALKQGDVKQVPPEIGGVSLDDLKGFVGHWDEEGRLLGLRVDKRDVRKELQSKAAQGNLQGHEGKIQSLQIHLSGKDTDRPYISLHNFQAYKRAFEKDWKHFLYTGDYDLHEVYKTNKALLEGSPEKARLLSGINDSIALNQNDNLPKRSGSIGVHKATVKIGEGLGRRSVPADTLHANFGSDYAMIQHGDQMGYITNQIHESRQSGASSGSKAQLVPAVASESSDRLAWCVIGHWYVTNNLNEHHAFRKGLDIVSSSAWSPSKQSEIAKGQSGIMEHKSSNPTKIGGN